MKITIDFDNKTINPVGEVNISELNSKIQQLFPSDYWEWKIEAAQAQGQIIFPTYPAIPTYPATATPVDPFYGQYHVSCLEKTTV